MDSQPLDLLNKSIINQIIGINKNILDIGGC
jgi:putative cell wall-binding protein